MAKIAPSILAGDHGDLAAEARRVEEWGADWIHVDIMDGVFAPNLTFGPGAVKALRRAVSIPLDCHLMISEPWKFADRFLEAGGDYITVHAEAVDIDKIHWLEEQVMKFGRHLGVAFKPSTPLSRINLNEIKADLLTIMTVNPGFSGQKFMPEVVPKIRDTAQLFNPSSRRVEIEVDGGIDRYNAYTVSEAGATVLVAGNSIFGKSDKQSALKELKKFASEAV